MFDTTLIYYIQFIVNLLNAILFELVITLFALERLVKFLPCSRILEREIREREREREQ